LDLQDILFVMTSVKLVKSPLITVLNVMEKEILPTIVNVIMDTMKLEPIVSSVIINVKHVLKMTNVPNVPILTESYLTVNVRTDG